MLLDKIQHKVLPVNIYKKLNFIKLIICEIFNKVEFHIFYHCLNKKLNDYQLLCHESQSIDALITFHLKLLKDIYLHIGLKDTVRYIKIDFFCIYFFVLILGTD